MHLSPTSMSIPCKTHESRVNWCYGNSGTRQNVDMHCMRFVRDIQLEKTLEIVNVSFRGVNLRNVLLQ